MKGKPQTGRKSKHISDKRLVFRICEERTEPCNKTTNRADIFTKDIQMANKYMKDAQLSSVNRETQSYSKTPVNQYTYTQMAKIKKTDKKC